MSGSRGRGKSGLHETRVAGNARRTQVQGKCHREKTAKSRPVFGPGKTSKGERVR
jgi:hypothetical protein